MILDNTIRTLSCDAEGCDKKVVFDHQDKDVTFNNPDNVWMKSIRVVQSADGRNIVYCSDACEVKGTATGKHNIPEPKKVQVASNAQVEATAKLAAARRSAEEALRTGQPTNIQITD